MRPIRLVIKPKETGVRIRTLMEDRGYQVKDLQIACDFMNPQAVYRWLRGDALPSLENLLILSRVLNIGIEDLLVIEERNDERHPVYTGSSDNDFDIAC